MMMKMIRKENMHSHWKSFWDFRPNLSTEIIFYNCLISLLFTSGYIKNTNHLKKRKKKKVFRLCL